VIKRKKILNRAMTYRRMVRRMRQMPEAQPSSDFTRRTMTCILADKTAGDITAVHRGQSLLDELWQWRGPTRWIEFSMCLFAVMFIYMLLGAILYFGFQFLEGRTMLPYWIKIQAPYALCTALGLLAVSLYTLKRDARAIRVARSAITIHLGLAAILLVMVIGVTKEAALLTGLLSFTSIHLIFGLFLALVVHRFKPDRI
jgi:hypothetical protein